MKFTLPEQVNTALKLLLENGFEAYAVGGCVRDLVMGKMPNDYDITTNAMPEETEKVFEGFRIIETGIKHGTVTVIADGMPLEITTYRIDGEYLDSRHPETVSFSRNLKDDLSRRDFTVNTLCYNEKEGVIDLFGGIEDIDRKIIRCVGEPDKRFNEDALRILRGIRFACSLGFTVEEETAQSILRNKDLIKNIAAERVRDEFVKLITADRIYDNVSRFREVIEVFIPEYGALTGCEQNTPYHCYDVFEHSVRSAEYIENDRNLRLTMFLHDIAKPLCKTTDEFGTDHFKGHAKAGAEMAEDILRRMKFDNNAIKYVPFLIGLHSERFPVSKTEAKEMLRRIGREAYLDFIKVRRADTLAKKDPHSKDEKIKNMLAFYEAIEKNGECWNLESLAVNGSDIKELGVKSGPEIKRLLDFALGEVIHKRVPNDKQSILNLIEDLTE